MKRLLLISLVGLVAAAGTYGCSELPTDPDNLPAVARAGADLIVVDSDDGGDEIVTLDGSESFDSDGQIERWAWTRGGTLLGEGPTTTVNLEVGTHTITLTVTDNDGGKGTDQVVVDVVDPSTAPLADAGPDQAVTDTNGDGSESVTLDGTGSSDPAFSGALSSYVWTEGSAEIATGPSPTVSLAVGTHTLTLTVRNSAGVPAADTVVITVNPSGGGGGGNNNAPAAAAGPDQTVTDSDNSGAESVTLNGSGSTDSDGTITNHRWTVGGAQVATGASPTVSFAVGTHTVTLTVTDDDGATDTDTVLITVNAGGGGGNLPPVADAGPDQTVTDTDGNGSEVVTLDGSGTSDPDGGIAGAQWTENGTTLGTGQFPSVTLAVGTHTIVLTVTDNQGATDTDTVVITVQPQGGGGNVAPTAHAGADQTVTDSDDSGAENVTLNSSASSDSDGTIVSRVWRENGAQIATGTSPTVSFAVGSHTVQLTVTDDGGLTDTDTVVITVNAGAGNQAPTAHAGADQTVTDSDNSGAENVTLNSSASSDSDGTIVSRVWRENGAQIATGTSPQVPFAVGTHTVQLTVTDDGGLTDTDTVVITVNAGSSGVSYAADIQPYFTQYCVLCHGGSAGTVRNVDLRTYNGLMAGGNQGPNVVPGNANQGTLMPKMNEGHQGAPHGTSITQDLTTWINAGAQNN